jgi:hypothetical protein
VIRAFHRLSTCNQLLDMASRLFGTTAETATSGLGKGQDADCCEHGDEHSGSITYGECLD